jgi:hypothetical protein
MANAGYLSNKYRSSPLKAQAANIIQVKPMYISIWVVPKPFPVGACDFLAPMSMQEYVKSTKKRKERKGKETLSYKYVYAIQSYY